MSFFLLGVPGKLKTLLDRLTATRAGYLDAAISTRATPTQVNTQVDSVLNAAVPGSPTSNSMYERVAAVDDRLTSTRATKLDTCDAASVWANSTRTLTSIFQTQVFTSSGTFNVPTNVTIVWLTGTGAGGGGGVGGYSPTEMGGGGGSGQCCFDLPVPVTAGAAITVTIGAGGIGGDGSPDDGGDGGDTIFASSPEIRLRGGKGGRGDISNAPGGAGGGLIGAGASNDLANANEGTFRAIGAFAFWISGSGGGAEGRDGGHHIHAGGSGGTGTTGGSGGAGGAFGAGADGGNDFAGQRDADDAAANSGAGGGGGADDGGYGGDGGSGYLVVRY